MQLRELALLNGTLRENDGPRCSNCGAADHKSWMVSKKFKSFILYAINSYIYNKISLNKVEFLSKKLE